MLGKIVFALSMCFAPFLQAEISETALSVDFRKPEYKCSVPCRLEFGPGTEFNPKCGKSWKIDKYDAKTKEFAYIELEWTLQKEEDKDYALELLACARKDPPYLSNVTIQVNDQTVFSGYHMYNGPDSIHFPDQQGKPSHLRWDVFQITEFLKDGKNKIRISLDQDTQSGISMSWLHVRPFPRDPIP